MQSSKQTPLPVLQLGSFAAKAEREALVVIRKSMCGSVCDWGDMKQSIVKEQDLKGEKEDVIFLVARLLFQQDCMAFQLERVWKLNLELPPSPLLLTVCMDLICLGEVGTTLVTSIMLFSEVSLYPNIESCFGVCYMVTCSKTITTKECLLQENVEDRTLCFFFQVILSLEYGLWAPNLHFNTPNPDIPALQDGSLEVVCKPIPVKGGFVSINNFGFGGANAHIILRPNENKHQALETCNTPRLVQVCGRTQEAVEILIQESRKHGGCSPFASLLSDISVVPVSSMPYRGYTLVGTESDIKEVQHVQASGRPLWYVCSGRCAAVGPGFCIPL